ncbi:MAG TPA: cytochrome c [Hyphomicrobiales bacterium]|nr:cytochrome c [Kaistiaceae bacterium]HQF31362.1 cytochrome c [Hyphomicrobiales bacterium]
MRRLAIAAALTVLSLDGAGAVEAGADAAAIERGRIIAVAVCGDCHAVMPGAVSPLPIAPPLYFLAEDYPLEAIEEALGEGMVTGHEGMPEILLDPIQIDEFLAFLASVQIRRPPP